MTQYLYYSRVWQVAASVTFGISRPEGPQPLGVRNFQITVTFELAR